MLRNNQLPSEGWLPVIHAGAMVSGVSGCEAGLGTAAAGAGTAADQSPPLHTWE